MANNDIISRLILDDKGYKQSLTNAAQSVQKFADKNLSASNIMKNATAAVGKMAAGIGIATGAYEALNKTIDSSQTLTDAFGRTMEAATASVDSFFYAVGKGDMSGFLGNLKDVQRYAKEAYNALDDLGTFNIFKGAEVAELNQNREELRAQIKSGRRFEKGEDGQWSAVVLTDEDIAEAKRKLEELDKQYVQIVATTREKEMDAYNAMAKEILSTNLATGTKEELEAAADYFLRNYENYSEVATRLQQLNDQVKANTIEKASFTGGGMTGYTQYITTSEMNDVAKGIKNSQEYRMLTALYEIGDEKLKQLIQHRINAAMASSELNRALSKDAATVKEIAPKPAVAESVIEMVGPSMPDAQYFEGITDGFDAEDLPLVGLIDETKGKWDEFIKSLTGGADTANDVLGGIGEAFDSIGTIIGGTAGETVKGIGQLVKSMESMVPVIEAITMAKKQKEIASKQEAAAEGMSAATSAGNAVASIPIAGPALAIAAIASVLGMMASVAQIAFAEGGVVPGQTFGDGLMARVSSGEVVMNSHDAKNLYDAIHSGNLGGGGGGLIVRGEDLVQAVNNYGARTGRGSIQFVK